MKTLRNLAIVIAAAVIGSVGAAAQSMRAVTSAAGAGLHVVVTWPPPNAVQRFNLYRKLAADPSFPASPLNGSPLQRLTSCAAIKAVIAPASPEWTLIAKGLADSPSVDFDPCAIGAIAPGSPQETKLYFLARGSWKLALITGLAYDDTAAVNGTFYAYQLHGVNGAGVETGTLFTNAAVTAGAPPALPPPPALKAAAGDNRVLLLWGDQPDAAGFVVLRSTNAVGPYFRVNNSAFLTKITQDLLGKPLPASSNGLLDIQRWDATGHPATHDVQGVPVAGPADGVSYFYEVASLDLLDRQGPLSAPAGPVTPLDKTPPAAPSGIGVKAVDAENRLEIRWNIVEFDIDGHAESSLITGYQVHRYDFENAPLASGLPIGALIPQPPAGVTYVTASDNSPALRPPFGEKTFWYRIEVKDALGNVSARSAAAGGHLKDIVPPAPPVGIDAEGFDDFIRVKWKANTEPDLDGYQIYRGLCHNGVSNPCDPRSFDKPQGDKPEGRVSDIPPAKGSQTPCTGEYVLVGTVSLTEAKAMGANPHFDDRSVPKGSPLCYSYWVKAIDKSQNQSGNWPFPDPAKEKTVCQRLRDKTPPDPAIISGLFARDRAIRVEWIGPPVQDIRAYQVYRADAESGSYKFVGGMTVELPPAIPQVLTSPYKPPPVVGCDRIPLVTIDAMSMGFFIDKRVEEKAIYWYKVVGIDQSGNEAPLDRATPVSTFTFTTAPASNPAITSVAGSTTAPLGLIVTWVPSFDSNAYRGFALFRSTRFDGLYQQIGTLLNASSYQDNQVVRGVPYWYKVVAMDKTGQVSMPSPPQSGTLP